MIRAQLAPQFYFGEDAVLLAMDTAGVAAFLASLTQAVQQGASRLDHGATIHQFLIEAGAADIEFDNDDVVWRLDHAKAAEIIELLTDMSQRPGAGHYYVDISAPAKTLVISLDEYT